MHLSFTLFALCLVSINGSGSAQDSTSSPCSQPESRQFDFWIGDWDLTWQGKEGIARGTNRIRLLYDGCVMREEFSDSTRGFFGMSVSSYSPGEKLWKQTWVDNQGGYLDFTGGWNNERMILSRSASSDKPILQRMVWYNISHDSLDWNWERSDDEGKTWNILWQIHYQRNSSQ